MIEVREVMDSHSVCQYRWVESDQLWPEQDIIAGVGWWYALVDIDNSVVLSVG